MAEHNENRKTVSKKSPISKALVPIKKPAALSNKETQQLLTNIKETVLSLHLEIGELGVCLLLAVIQAGKYLRAAKNLLQHGQFEPFWKEHLSHRFELRTAQRYMELSLYTENNMPAIRAKLQEMQPTLDVQNMNDECILRSLPLSVVTKMLSEEKTTSKKIETSVVTLAKATLSTAFTEAVNYLVGDVGSFLSTAAIDITALRVMKSFQQLDPLQAKVEGDGPVLALADTSRRNKHWLSEVVGLFQNQSVAQVIVVLPLKCLDLYPELFGFPEVILTAQQVFSESTLGKSYDTTFVAVLLSAKSDVQQFASAFSSLGSVKSPVIVR
jgi:hypothetical protein